MSLRLRIVLTYVFLVVISFSCVIYVIINDVRPRYLEAVEESVVDTAELIAAMLSRQVRDGELHIESLEDTMRALDERRFKARIYNIIKRKVALQIYITNAQGILLYDSSGRAAPGDDFSQWNDVLRTIRGEYGARSTRTNPADPSTSVLHVAAPIMKNGELFGVVSVGKPSNSISFLITIAQRRFLLSLLFVGLTGIALALGLSYWITRPVKKLTDYANAIQAGEERRLPALGRSEIGSLGRALEEMQAKLEGKNYIEDYIRALTHELKSPITGIKGAGEILRGELASQEAKKFLDNIDSDVERLSSLVERMLQLSRLENVRAVAKTRFSAAVFLQGLAQGFQTQLEKRGQRIALDLPFDMQLEGDKLLLGQAVGNLVSNAMDFSPDGAVIELKALEEAGEQVIIVRDYGAGIPDFAHDKVFDKFFSLSRPGSGKKSTGLGLPFVREVVALHGGVVKLVDMEPGLEARIVLPL